jgi:hypothetical protein
MLEGQKGFPVSCGCGHTVLRTPDWLRENTHPFCPKCGSDVTVSRNEAMETYISAERKLAEPIQKSDNK